MSSNTVKSVHFVRKGEVTLLRTADSGYCRGTVAEDGYDITLADCRVFVPLSLLKQARRRASMSLRTRACRATLGGR